MKTFHLTLFDGHPTIEDNGNTILLDTGAPTTIHIADKIEFMSDMHDAPMYLGDNLFYKIILFREYILRF